MHALLFQITLEEGGLVQEAQEFNADFVKGILPRIDWAALKQTAAEVCCFTCRALLAQLSFPLLQLGIAQLPDEVPATAAQDDGFLRSVHTLILEVHVKEGALVCGNCQRVYPITKGIPNMLLNEDEV